MKKYYDESKTATNKELCEYIFNDYIDGIELEETQKLMSKLPLLVDNNLACCISGTDDVVKSCETNWMAGGGEPSDTQT